MQASQRWLQFQVGNERYALPVETVAQVVGLDDLRHCSVPGWVGLLPLRGGAVPLADGGLLVGETVRADRPRARGLVLRARLPIGLTVDHVFGVTAGAARALLSRVGLPDLAAGALLNGESETTIVLDAERLWRLLRAGLEQRADGGGFRLLPLDRRGEFGPASARNGQHSGPVCRVKEGADSTQQEPIPVPAAPIAPPIDQRARLAAPSGGMAAVAAPVAAALPDAALVAAPSGAAGPTVAIDRPSAPLADPAAALAEPPPVQELARPDLRAAAAPPGAVADRVLVFRVGIDLDLAVPADRVLEIGPHRAPRPLRGGPSHLAGLLDWRGHLVPMVDLPARLNSGLAGPRQTLYLALEGRAARAVAVVVGEVAGQAELGEALAPVPTDSPVPAAWARGAAQFDGRPLIVLDPAALVAA